MNKSGIIIIIIILLSLVVLAPFTLRDQIEGFLSLFSNDSADQNGRQNSGTELKKRERFYAQAWIRGLTGKTLTMK